MTVSLVVTAVPALAEKPPPAPSKSVEQITNTDDEPITYHEYDLVIDKQGVSGTSTYNATVAGITAPIPEARTLILLMTGILCLFGILYLRRRRERQM